VGFKVLFHELTLWENNCERRLRQGAIDFSESADAPFQEAEQSKVQYTWKNGTLKILKITPRYP
jgi:hypothetical protein